MRVIFVSYLLLVAADAFVNETDGGAVDSGVFYSYAASGSPLTKKDNLFDNHVQARHAKSSKSSKSSKTKSSKGSKTSKGYSRSSHSSSASSRSSTVSDSGRSRFFSL